MLSWLQYYLCRNKRLAGANIGGWAAIQASRLACVRASVLLRFISRCYVAVCVSVSTAMWVRPEKIVEAIQASQSTGTVITTITARLI